MRDFYNGGDITAGGNINIYDQSHNTRPLLVDCTSEFLKYHELPYRKENLRREFWAKVGRIKYFFFLALILFVGSVIWTEIQGQKDLATLLVQLASFFLTAAGVKGIFEPNEFELQERADIQKIRMILKARRDD